MAQPSLPSHLQPGTPPPPQSAPAAKLLVISEQRTHGEITEYTWVNQPGLPVPFSQSRSYSLASILAADPSLLTFLTDLIQTHWKGWVLHSVGARVDTELDGFDTGGGSMYPEHKTSVVIQRVVE